MARQIGGQVNYQDIREGDVTISEYASVVIVSITGGGALTLDPKSWRNFTRAIVRQACKENPAMVAEELDTRPVSAP